MVYLYEVREEAERQSKFVCGGVCHARHFIVDLGPERVVTAWGRPLPPLRDDRRLVRDRIGPATLICGRGRWAVVADCPPSRLVELFHSEPFARELSDEQCGAACQRAHRIVELWRPSC